MCVCVYVCVKYYATMESEYSKNLPALPWNPTQLICLLIDYHLYLILNVRLIDPIMARKKAQRKILSEI